MVRGCGKFKMKERYRQIDRQVGRKMDGLKDRSGLIDKQKQEDILDQFI